MDAITLLKDDHKTVAALFKRFENAGDQAFVEKREIVDKIIEELSIHAAVEEQLFYPVTRATVPETEDVALESLEEHHIVKWVLSELDGMDPKDERFDAKVTVLIENVRHHVEEEEEEYFPKVRDELGRNALSDLGEAMAAAKKAAPTHPHPRSPDTPPGNLVVGAAAGVVDRVGDTVNGVAQGGVTALGDVIATVLRRKKPSSSPRWQHDRTLDRQQGAGEGRRSHRRRHRGHHRGARRGEGASRAHAPHREGHQPLRQAGCHQDRQGRQVRRQGHGHLGPQGRQADDDHRQAGRHVGQAQEQHRPLRRQGHEHLGEEGRQAHGDDGQARRHDHRPHGAQGRLVHQGHRQAGPPHLRAKELASSWDPLLSDDWPAEWSPFTVVVRPLENVIELVAEGHLDGWTVGALVRTLAAVYEPSFTEVHVDLHGVTSTDGMAEAGLNRCREFATERRVAFRVTPPQRHREPSPFEGQAAVLPFAAS